MALYGKGHGPGGDRPMGDDDEEKRGLDNQIATDVEGNLKRPSEVGQPEKLQPKDQVIDAVTNKINAGLKDESPDGEAQLDEGMTELGSLWRMRKGVPYKAESVGHTANYDTKLDPATANFLQHEPALRQNAGSVVTDINRAKVESDRARITSLGNHARMFTQLGADCDATRTHPEQRIDKVLRNVADRIEPMRKPLGPIYDELGPVRDYAGGSAQKGVQTRVMVGRAVASAEEKTAALYEQQGQSPGSGTQAGPGTASGMPGSGATGAGTTGGLPTATMPGTTGAMPQSSQRSAPPPGAKPPRTPKGRSKRSGG